MTNRFEVLKRHDNDEGNNATVPNPKPPPIFIEAQSIDPLIETISQLLDTKAFVMKQLKNSQIKLQTYFLDAYRKTVNVLNTKHANYHIYQPKQEKNYKVVIKGLHPKINIKKIEQELQEAWHKVKSITNIIKRRTQQPMPMFLTELAPADNNKEICNIKIICNMMVTMEAPRAKKDIPQCSKCQKHGHTRNYCSRRPACVKGAQQHLSYQCPIQGKIQNVKCVNCQGNHPASYKGCIVRKKFQDKLYPTLRVRYQNDTKQTEGVLARTPTLTHTSTPGISRQAKTTNIPYDPVRSYAQVISNTLITTSSSDTTQTHTHRQLKIQSRPHICNFSLN